MAHAVRGLLLLSVYSGGFSSVCLICHFNAPVGRFNGCGYPYTAAVPLVLYPLFMVLWRGVVLCSVAFRLRCQLAAVLVPLWTCRRLCPAPAVRARGAWGFRWLLRRAWLSAKVAGKVSGKVSKVAGIVAVKVASTCAKVARFTPKS